MTAPAKTVVNSAVRELGRVTVFGFISGYMFMFLANISCGTGIPANLPGQSTDDPPAGSPAAPLDTDGDLFPDDIEINSIPGTDPLDSTDSPSHVRDTDRDGCSDFDELNFDGFCDNDPVSGVDTDQDGLTDSAEATFGTDPAVRDTDLDGLTDAEEVSLGWNPLVADSDSDGLMDGEEFANGTNPFQEDTDFDSLSDGFEIHTVGTSPTDSDTDNDGLSDGLELNEVFDSDPTNPDTDGDGFLDGEEFDLGLDLTEPNPTGVITSVLCRNFVTATSGAITGIFEISDVLFTSFPSGFIPGDRVAFSSEPLEGHPIGGIVLNLRSREIGWSTWGGPEHALEGGFIVDSRSSDFGLSIEIIVSSGLTWAVVFPETAEVSDWLLGDLVTIYGPSGFPGTGKRMLNLNACEAIHVFP